MDEEMSRTDILRIVANEILLSEDFIGKITERIVHQLDLENRQLIDNLTACVVHLENENDRIKEELDVLRFSINRIEQHSRKNNIRIFRVPENPKEDTDKVVADIFEKYLKLKINKSQIKNSERIGKVQNGRIRSILVKFVNHSDKMEVFRRKRFLKASGIVIKEDLSAQNFQLYNSAIQQFTLKNVWTNDGIVYISAGNRTYRIKSEAELNELVNKFTPPTQSNDATNDMTIYQVNINTGPIDAVTLDDPSNYPSTSTQLTSEEISIAQTPPVEELVIVDPIFDEAPANEPIFNELPSIVLMDESSSVISEEIIVEPDVETILNEPNSSDENMNNEICENKNDTADESTDNAEENNETLLDTASAVMEQTNSGDDSEGNSISDSTTVIATQVDDEPVIIENPNREFFTELIFNIRINPDNTINLTDIDDIESDDDFAISIDIQEIYQRNRIIVEPFEDEDTEPSAIQEYEDEATDPEEQDHDDDSDNNNSSDLENDELADREESVIDENENRNENEDSDAAVVYDLVNLETDEIVNAQESVTGENENEDTTTAVVYDLVNLESDETVKIEELVTDKNENNTAAVVYDLVHLEYDDTASIEESTKEKENNKNVAAVAYDLVNLELDAVIGENENNAAGVVYDLVDLQPDETTKIEKTVTSENKNQNKNEEKTASVVYDLVKLELDELIKKKLAPEDASEK